MGGIEGGEAEGGRARVSERGREGEKSAAVAVNSASWLALIKFPGSNRLFVRSEQVEKYDV